MGGGGIEPAGEYTFFYEKGNENHDLGTSFFIHKRIMPRWEAGDYVCMYV
jgi:hypothetical protein